MNESIFGHSISSNSIVVLALLTFARPILGVQHSLGGLSIMLVWHKNTWQTLYSVVRQCKSRADQDDDSLELTHSLIAVLCPLKSSHIHTTKIKYSPCGAYMLHYWPERIIELRWRTIHIKSLSNVQVWSNVNDLSTTLPFKNNQSAPETQISFYFQPPIRQTSCSWRSSSPLWQSHHLCSKTFDRKPLFPRFGCQLLTTQLLDVLLYRKLKELKAHQNLFEAKNFSLNFSL